MQDMIYRCHYRAQLDGQSDPSLRTQALRQCEASARAQIDAGRLMTAALYYYHDHLFLYYEAVGAPCTPDIFMAALEPFLTRWPSLDGARAWAQMYPYYYHCLPQSVQDWRRKTQPQRRRGRIARLDPQRMFSYLYHHLEIVREGLFPGDPYQSIALHEDILFSYFEEPRGNINIRRDLSQPSKAIEKWQAADPAAHFISFPEAEGANFLLLEDYFALGEML
jgi:hypothetical protein